MASANLANSVALLSPPVRGNHKARKEDMSAQSPNEPPADVFIKVDDAILEQDTAWYSGGDTNTTCTMGDTRIVEQFSDVPQLVGRTEGGRRPALPSPPAYDWRTDTGRGHSAHPFGSPQDGDTYRRDGDAYHTVGGGAVLQPIDLITRWLEQLPGQLNGAHRGATHDDFVN